MKKFLAFAAAILFVGVLSLSLLAFSEDDPRKQKTETAQKEQCDQHMEAVTGTAETKPCCQESTENASTGCKKSAECEHHNEKTAEVK